MACQRGLHLMNYDIKLSAERLQTLINLSQIGFQSLMQDLAMQAQAQEAAAQIAAQKTEDQPQPKETP